MNNLDRIINKLKSRFTTKVFDYSFKIEENVEDKIEEIFNLAPTSFGLQPFKLIKISSKKDREAIKRISWEQRQIIDCSLLYVLAIETNKNAVLERYEKLQISVRKIKTNEALRYSEFIKNFLSQKDFNDNFYEPWATRQMYLSLGFFLSIAAILDIDTAPIEGFDEKMLDEIFDLKKYSLGSKVLLCIGKRANSDEYLKLAKIRKQKSDLMLYI